jgi:hypothetical protein
VGLVKIFPQLQKQFQVCLHRPSFQVQEASLPDIYEALQVQPFRYAHLLGIQEASPPGIQWVSHSGIQEASLPDIQGVSHSANPPGIQEARPPGIKGVSHTGMQEASLPGIQEASPPAIQGVSHSGKIGRPSRYTRGQPFRYTIG